MSHLYQRLMDDADPARRASAVKDGNPKDAIGSRKISLSVVPLRVLWGLALAMTEGALKYGRHNYRAAGVRASVYFDACVGRHLIPWMEGEDIDEDSGINHIDKAIACLVVLRDSMYQGNMEDDRAPRSKVKVSQFNALVPALHDRHKDKSQRHYTIKDDL